ncbi:hypothetical protein ACH5RR_034549 [Cinchona calisaya]|uniref:Uncharacterized protein n=1 Tax=Cinchona calisaya TaxID=153742 RepID=A0ABD2YGN9_9GENT
MSLVGFLHRLLIAPAIRYFRHLSIYDELTDFSPLTPFIQNQLREVYLTLSSALACMALGYELNLHWKIGGFMSVVVFVGMSASFFFTPRWRQGRRFCILMIAAFRLGFCMYLVISYCLHRIDDMIRDRCGGDSMIIRLIDLFFTMDPSNLSNAFIGAGIVFLCFAMASTLTEERGYMYANGVLLSADVLLYWLSSYASNPYKPNVILGFFFFMLYVAAYSQEMVVQIHHGQTCWAQHAIELFTRIPAFLVHIVCSLIRRQRRADLTNDMV